MSDRIYTAQHVANFFLTKAEKEGYGLTPLKLLKIVYIGYGWVLALTGRKLFDEPIQAWQHGPVVPSLYHEFKEFGSGVILSKSVLSEIEEYGLTFNITLSNPEIPEDDEDVVFILGRAWDVYKDLGGWELRNKTHETDTPWSKVYSQGRRDCDLRDEDISNYYKAKLDEYLAYAN